MIYKKIFPNPRSHIFTSISFPRSFIDSYFDIRMRIHLELVYIYEVSWVSNFIFLHAYPVVYASFVEKTVLLLLNCPAPCQNSIDH